MTIEPAGKPAQRDHKSLMEGIRAKKALTDAALQQAEGSLLGYQSRAEQEARARMETQAGREAIARDYALAQTKLAEETQAKGKLEEDIRKMRISLDQIQKEKAEAEGKLAVEAKAREDAAKSTGELTALRGTLEQKLEQIKSELRESNEAKAGASGLAEQRTKDLAAQRVAFETRDRVYSQRITDLEGQVRGYEMDLTNMREQYAEKDAEAQRLAEEAAQAYIQIATADAARKEESEAKVAVEARLLAEQKRIGALECERKQLYEQKTAGDKKYATLEGTVREKDAVIASKEREIAKKDGLISARDKTYEELTQRFAELEGQKRAADDELSTARSEIERVTAEYDKVRGEYSTLLAEKTELETSLVEVATAYDELHERVVNFGKGKSPVDSSAPNSAPK